MSQWIDRIVNHPIHALLNETKTLLSSFTSKDSGNSDVIDATERVKHVIDVAIKLVSSADPTLLTPSQLDPLASTVRTLNKELTNFKSNLSIGHLTNANSHADTILVLISNILTPSSSQYVESIRESVTTYKKSASQLIRRLEEEADTYVKQISELSNRIDESGKVVESQKGRLDTAIAEFQNQFSAGEDRRRIQAEELTRQTKTAHATASEKLESELQRMISKIQSDSQENINHLIEKRKEAANLVQIISNIGVTGNYDKSADENKKSANIWRLVAITFMFLMAGVGIWTVWYAVTEFDWKLTAARMFATLVLAVPSFYAARESEKHRTSEEYNRKKELELSSIGPYLETLSDVKREEIRGTLANKFFGQNDISGEKHDLVTAKSLLSLLKSTIQAITKK